MKRMNYMNENGFTAKHDPSTERVIGLAIGVQTELGSGFLESVYPRALAGELSEAAIHFEKEAVLEALYKGRSAGNFAADFIIERKLLLEIKALDFILPAHEVRVVNYLKATGLETGLILNFGSPTRQGKRKHRERLTPPSGLRLQEV
jgi:GxxExxY protein